MKSSIKKQIFILLIFYAMSSSGQESSIKLNYFGMPTITDSGSTIMLPIRYDDNFLSSTSLKFSGNMYANIIYYNYKTDSSYKLFPKNTFVSLYDFGHIYYDFKINEPQKKSSKYLFYKVANVDYNKNKKIDGDDPIILYVSDLDGKNLKRLTPENENVVSVELFEKLNFALVKLQVDSNNDGKFDFRDKVFYYIKLDLNTLTFGKKIEI